MTDDQQRQRLTPDDGVVEHSEAQDDAELARIANYWLNEPPAHAQARRALAAIELARMRYRSGEPQSSDPGQAATD